MKKPDRNAGAAFQDAMPPGDPAFSILSAILAVVPVSCWSFARVHVKGDADSLCGSRRTGKGLDGLADEFRRQRAKAPAGPRIAATLGSLEGFTSGITLVFADARASYGILVLLRSTELASFTSSEISVLTLALDAISERFSALRLHSVEYIADEQVPESDRIDAIAGAFYILDTDLHIVLAWMSEDQRRVASTGLQTNIGDRLPGAIEEAVRKLTITWTDESTRICGIAHPFPFLVVRTQPMSGPAGLFIGVHIERFQQPNSLTGAAARYHISPREIQVLALLLDGNHLDQIALQLHITSSTVQDHIKNMLDKTESRNRSELIGRVLGWQSAASAGA